MITSKVSRKDGSSSSGYCQVPSCKKQCNSLSVATSVALKFYGFLENKNVVKLCPECVKKAEKFHQTSVEALKHGTCVFAVEREPVTELPEMVDLESTELEGPVDPARNEMLALKYNRPGVESLVKAIMDKYKVDVQVKKCLEQTKDEMLAMEKEFDQLETKVKQVGDKIYETYKNYSKHVDPRAQGIVTEEWDINAEGIVKKRNLSDDAVFVNSKTLNRLQTLIENSSTAAVNKAKKSPATASDPVLDDCIVIDPETTPRTAGPASKTGYSPEGQRCRVKRKSTRPRKLRAKTQPALLPPPVLRPLELRVKTQVTLLPTPNRIPRVNPKKGDIIYGMHKNLITCWLQCEILDVIHNEATNATEFVVNFEPHRNGNPTGGQTGDGVKRVIRQLCLRQMAYNLPCPCMLPVGSRVIARYKEEGKKETDNDGLFYAGVIAEPAKKLTNNRYLVFFDNGYAQYVFPDDVLLVCEGSKNVWNDVYPDSYDFIRSYVINWPNWPMVKLAVGNRVSTEWNGKWLIAVVEKLDNHLAKVKFENIDREEWIYRGSTRFRPIYKIHDVEALGLLGSKPKENNIPHHDPVLNAPDFQYQSDPLNPKALKLALKSTSARRNFHRELQIFSSSSLTSNDINMLDPDLCVEFQGSLTTVKIPDDVKWKDNVPHKCTPSCALQVQYERSKEIRRLSPLAIPFHFGWRREETKPPRSQIIYRSPCGLHLRNIDALSKYLTTVQSIFTIDQFCFDTEVNCLSEFVPTRILLKTDDVFDCKENVAIQCINSVDHDTLPYMEYIPYRVGGPGVNLNTEKEFLVCCDCKDNCEDKEKCACWKLTHEGISCKTKGRKNPLPGYEHRRLHERIDSGIYECNSNCKCKSTCTNRVVQNGVQWPMQVFKTTKKGWAIRTVYDVPKGAFICIYSGEVLTDQSAEEKGQSFGDEYLTDLDYIELNEAEDEEMILEEEQARKDILSGDSDSDDSSARCERQTRKRRKTTRDLFGPNELCYTMDPKRKGNIGKYFNHSCDPNTFVQNVFVDTHDIRFPIVAFFTSNTIKAGTELTWDYKYKIGSAPGKAIYCSCMSKCCRGRLL